MMKNNYNFKNVGQVRFEMEQKKEILRLNYSFSYPQGSVGFYLFIHLFNYFFELQHFF